MTKLFMPTLLETPKEAEVISHKLMIKGGYIRILASGIYSYLPLAWRVLEKISRIIREEMNRAGGQELLLPILHPAELWKETDRWDEYGADMFRLRDRRDRSFGLGPTHEEVITDLVRREVRSYRDLPLILYQIQTKFRDELRPRFGIMRGREFIMKDGYSFDRSEKEAEETYRVMFDAYSRAFSRIGLRFREVEADTGLIGGRLSHEFMVLADSGEDGIISCEVCGYAANLERAEYGFSPTERDEAMKRLKQVKTPSRKTVKEVAEFLGVSEDRIVKTLIYEADTDFVACLLLGCHEINEAKLRKALGVKVLNMATPDIVERLSGAQVGFAGPVGLEGVRIIADLSLKGCRNLVVGANRDDTHFLNVNPGRDFKVSAYLDLRCVKEGDRCPRCMGRLGLSRGIEVGHVFYLGTKYSKPMKATFLDEFGKEQPIVMGCFGIGISRIMGACIEQSHDEKGIIWPISIAPYHVLILPVNPGDDAIREASEDLYSKLKNEGVEVLIDDRLDSSPGKKFYDADLIGIPLRVTIGRHYKKDGMFEVTTRQTGESYLVEKEGVLKRLKETLSGDLK